MTLELTPRRLWMLPSMPFSDFWKDAEEWMSTPWTQNGLSVYEDSKRKQVRFEAAVPGIDPKDIQVTYEDGSLLIRGESKDQHKDDNTTMSQHRSYFYKVAVPDNVDQSVEPEATYKHGVMTVAFATSSKPQPKQIQVKSIEK